MSDKDQFTFEDEDESPESNVTKKAPQEPDAEGGEIFFDTEEDLPGKSLGEQADTESSGKGSEEFFFDTEDDDSAPGIDTSTSDDDSLSGDEGLFGDNLNAGFPESEAEIDDPVDFAPEPQAKSADSKKRTLLMVLLLVLVAAGGAYYFMGLGSSTPSVPTVKMPVETPTKTVAVPPPPPPVKATEEKPAQKEKKAVTVAVPPPPAPAAVKTEAKPAVATDKAAPKAETAVKAKQETAKPAATSVAVPAPVPVPVPAKPAPVATAEAPKAPPVKAAEEPVVETVAAPKPVEVAKPAPAPKPVTPVKQVAEGSYALDAGSYLLASNKKALVAKIEKLGYQPLVTPVEATLNMTRLRLGTYSKDEVQSALASARLIEPGSYSAPAGDGYVLYAGTFLKTNNLEKIKKRFFDEGIQVKSEPVQVVRTLSRVRFGSFASKEDAAEAASAVEKAGVKVTVVKSK